MDDKSISNKLYPNLDHEQPTAERAKPFFQTSQNIYTYVNDKPPIAQNHRLSIIYAIQKNLEKNIEERIKYKKRYNRFLTVTNISDYVLMIIATLMGASEIGLLYLHLPEVVLGIQISTFVLILGSVISKKISRRFLLQIEKHQRILTLAESKLNTIQNHVSKALEDNLISVEEFILISEEEHKFIYMKKQIQDQYDKEVSKLNIGTSAMLKKEVEKERLLVKEETRAQTTIELKEKINNIFKINP
jgi:hypothetical protein